MSPDAVIRSKEVPACTDADLVTAIRAGETEVWGEVYERHLDRVYSVCFAVLRNRADAEDAAQTAFLKAVERIDQLRVGDALASWLCGIARRCAIDRIRATRETPIDEWPAASLLDEPDPTTGLRQTEAVTLVTEALDGLEARDRLALVLSDAQGCDGETLAATLGVRRDHAYVMVRRARGRFGRSITALVVGRTGTRECAELASIVRPGDVGLDPRQRKRVARHVEGCERCRRTRDAKVTPAALLSMLPPVVAPAALRARLPVATSSPGSPVGSATSARPVRAVRGFRVAAVVVAGAALAAVAALVVSISAARGDESVAGRPADSAPISAPATSAPASSAESSGVNQDYCTIAADWQGGVTPGPTAPDPAALEQWFTTSLDYVERLAAAAPKEVAARWAEYEKAYRGLVDGLGRSGWDLAATGAQQADPSLTVLRDELEADVSSRCGVDPGA